MMVSENRFPSQLLSEPIDQRLQYFKAKIIAHPRLKAAYDQLIQAIYHPTGASLVFVFGPTGVGKTTLRHRVEQRLIEDAWPDLERNPGRIPVVGIEAIAQSAEKFDWKDYYKRALLALDEPLIEHKIDYEIRGIERDAEGKLIIQYNVARSELRRALELCLNHRQLAAFIVDEAQHFNKVSGGRRLLDQMDSVKSLAGLTETIHALVGTYELLGLTDLSAQLSRRSVEIHFSRYRSDWAEDVEIFKSVLLTFQHHLPLREEPDLVNHYDYLYQGSVGCVGILKDWLTRALAVALKNDRNTLTLEHLEKQAVPTRQLLRMAREIKEGEELVMEREEQRAELRALLGMAPFSANGNKPDSSAAKKTKRRKRVGQRNPVRDVVGVN
jgi:hypothetical protein